MMLLGELKPFMFVARMINHEIKQNPDIILLRNSYKMTKILHSAKARVDFAVVNNVVTAVFPAALEKWVEPNVIWPDFLGNTRDERRDII